MTRAASVLVAILLSTALASAQEAPATRPSADEYTRRVRRGIEQLAGGDGAGAMTTFREAAALDGSRPEAAYYTGTAHRMGGNLEQALTSFQQAAALAQAASQPRWRARALHGVASTLERMEGRVEEARTAWQEYSRFADANQAVADPQLGRARIAAIDLMNEQEQAYVRVRQRIAEREEERRREQQEAARPRARGR